MRAWFAGLHDQALPVLADKREWLRQSLTLDEPFSDTPLLMSARVADVLALTTWLVGGQDDHAEYDDAEMRYQRYIDSDEARSDDVADDLARLRVSGRGRDLSADTVAAAMRHLSQKAEHWLDSGDTDRLAAWLKLAYWDSGLTGTPEDTLRRLPRHLPRDTAFTEMRFDE